MNNETEKEIKTTSTSLKDELDEILPTPKINKEEPNLTPKTDSVEDIAQILPQTKGIIPIDKLTNQQLLSQIKTTDKAIQNWRWSETEKEMTVDEWKIAKDTREVLTRELRKRHLS